jgi:Uma2 family endonuclease
MLDTTPSARSALAKHRISVAEYDRMVAAGVFHPRARLELIHGEIVEMTPVGPRHASRVDGLHAMFVTRLGKRVHVRSQGPVHMGAYSEPQPDVLLLRPRDDSYRDRHPGAADVLLVIELARTSLAFDRDVKGPLYRGEAVLEYWIVNLVDDTLEVHLRDEPAMIRTLRRGDTISPAAFPDLVSTVDEILGSPGEA